MGHSVASMVARVQARIGPNSVVSDRLGTKRVEQEKTVTDQEDFSLKVLAKKEEIQDLIDQVSLELNDEAAFYVAELQAAKLKEHIRNLGVG